MSNIYRPNLIPNRNLANAKPSTKPPVAQPPVAKPPVVQPQVVQPQVAQPPVAKLPVKKPVVKSTYYDQIFKRCKFLNTKTFRSDLKEIYDIILNSETPDYVKIGLGEWLYRKITMYYRPMADETKPICEQLKPSIRRCDNVVNKALYIKYTNINILREIAEHFYFDRFNDQDKFFVLQMLNDVQLIQSYDPVKMKDHFLEWIGKLQVYEQKSNLLDTLLRYFPGDRDVQKVSDEMKYGDKKMKNLYSNDQNAHDEEINLESLKAAEKLVEWYEEQRLKQQKIALKNKKDPPIEEKMTDYVAEFFAGEYKSDEVSECVLTRLKIDNSRFGLEKSFNILELMFYLIKYIKKSKSKDELTMRLHEEMDEMKELCASGYVNRMINALQGFDERYAVKISFESQLNAILTSKVSKHMDEMTDNEMVGSYNPEFRGEYIKFIIKIVNRYLPSIRINYGEKDVEDNIKTVMTKICNHDNWVYQKGVISEIDEVHDEENKAEEIEGLSDEEEDNSK